MVNSKLKRFLFSISLLTLISSNNSFATNANYIEGVSDTDLKIICDAFETIGIDCSLDPKSLSYRVYRDPKDKNIVRLRGEYADYKQFLSAYMIAQAVVGVSRVSPVFDTFDTNIKLRKTEYCLANAMIGNTDENCRVNIVKEPPPGIKEQIGKEKRQFDKVAILISIGRFAIEGYNLGDAPHHDAALVKERLEGAGYKVFWLKDEQATKRNVLDSINYIVNNVVTDNGTLFIYASSHGAPKDLNGETGIIMYDYSHINKCDLQNVKNESISNIKTRDIILAANELCLANSNSIILKEDVFPILNNSDKRIKLLVNLDICYSGGVFKSILSKKLKDINNVNNVINDSYSNTEDVAKYLTSLYPYKFIYVSSSSGSQTSMQKTFSEDGIGTLKNRDITISKTNEKKYTTQTKAKEHGIFTYYFYNELPKSNFNIKEAFNKSFPSIKNESGEVCRSAKQQSRGENINCDEKGQNPLMMYNIKVSEADFKLK